MSTNPIIDEIHRIREAHAKRFNYDIDAIFADLRRRDAECKNLSKLKPVKPRRALEVAEPPAAYVTPRRRPNAGSGKA
jgi:hypothetical protein